MATDVLAVMAKAPRLGCVKTRLAQRVGEAAALELYRAFLRDIAGRFASSTLRLAWAVDPPGSDLSGDVGGAAFCIGQRGRDLGERMHNCFLDLFAGGARSVIVIGSDAPHLGEREIESSVLALDTADVVLTPSEDGGYCLVGMKDPCDLFTPITMSTRRVFAETLDLAASRGLVVHCNPTSFDVDTLEDARRLASLAAEPGADLPATRRILRSWQRRGLL